MNDAGFEHAVAEVLHVGSGTYARDKLPPMFRHAGWREIRLDIDPNVHPDIIASITDMRGIPNGGVAAVYSSHNVEHLYPHEVPLALNEMRRVLAPGGFAYVALPDLQEVARHIATGLLEDPLYISPLGPIAPLDILYGYRPAMASGNIFMAHHTGFTSGTLGAALMKAGFSVAMVSRDLSAFCLTAIAFPEPVDEDRLARMSALIPATPGRSTMFYATASG